MKEVIALKKYLSLFLSSLMFCLPFCQHNVLAEEITSDSNHNENTVDVRTGDLKPIDNQGTKKEIPISSPPASNVIIVRSEDSRPKKGTSERVKNVVDHPFKILFRGFWWAILGEVVRFGARCIGLACFPLNYLELAGLVCGMLSKGLELYLEN